MQPGNYWSQQTYPGLTHFTNAPIPFRETSSTTEADQSTYTHSGYSNPSPSVAGTFQVVGGNNTRNTNASSSSALNNELQRQNDRNANDLAACISELEAELNATRDRCICSEDLSRSLHQENAALKGDLEHMAQQLQKAQKQVQEKAQQLVALQSHVQSLVKERDQLQAGSTVQAFTQEREALQAQSQALAHDKDQLQAQREALEGERQQLQAQTEALAQERQQLQAQVEALAQERQQLQAKAEQVKAVEPQQQSSRERVPSAGTADLEAQLKSLSQEREQLQAQASSLARERDELRARTMSLSQELLEHQTRSTSPYGKPPSSSGRRGNEDDDRMALRLQKAERALEQERIGAAQLRRQLEMLMHRNSSNGGLSSPMQSGQSGGGAAVATVAASTSMTPREVSSGGLALSPRGSMSTVTVLPENEQLQQELAVLQTQLLNKTVDAERLRIQVADSEAALSKAREQLAVYTQHGRRSIEEEQQLEEQVQKLRKENKDLLAAFAKLDAGQDGWQVRLQAAEDRARAAEAVCLDVQKQCEAAAHTIGRLIDENSELINKINAQANAISTLKTEVHRRGLGIQALEHILVAHSRTKQPSPAADAGEQAADNSAASAAAPAAAVPQDAVLGVSLEQLRVMVEAAVQEALKSPSLLEDGLLSNSHANTALKERNLSTVSAPVRPAEYAAVSGQPGTASPLGGIPETEWKLRALEEEVERLEGELQAERSGRQQLEQQLQQRGLQPVSSRKAAERAVQVGAAAAAAEPRQEDLPGQQGQGSTSVQGQAAAEAHDASTAAMAVAAAVAGARGGRGLPVSMQIQALAQALTMLDEELEQERSLRRSLRAQLEEAMQHKAAQGVGHPQHHQQQRVSPFAFAAGSDPRHAEHTTASSTTAAEPAHTHGAEVSTGRDAGAVRSSGEEPPSHAPAAARGHVVSMPFATGHLAAHASAWQPPHETVTSEAPTRTELVESVQPDPANGTEQAAAAGPTSSALESQHPTIVSMPPLIGVGLSSSGVGMLSLGGASVNHGMPTVADETHHAAAATMPSLPETEAASPSLQPGHGQAHVGHLHRAGSGDSLDDLILDPHNTRPKKARFGIWGWLTGADVVLT